MRKQAITEKKFTSAKVLIQNGLGNKEIADCLEIGVSTVSRIKVAKNYDDFCAARRDGSYSVKPPERKPALPEVKQVVEYRQGVTIIANQYMAEQLKKQVELLTGISNKLAFIVDELCGTQTRKED